MKRSRALLLAAAVGLAGTAALAEGIDDPARAILLRGLQGKKVAFVPVAMGFDLTEGWAAGIRKKRSSRSA